MVSIVAGNPCCARSLSCQLFCPPFNPDVTFCQEFGRDGGYEYVRRARPRANRRIGDPSEAFRGEALARGSRREGLGGTF